MSDAASAPGTWVWFPGVSWEGVDGTDKHLVTAVARHRRVVWVDPPLSCADERARSRPWSSIAEVGDGIVRVSTVSPPGVTRPGLRQLSRALVARNARRAVARQGGSIEAVVVSTPEQQLPTWTGRAVRLYYETDDFVAGAELLGLSLRALERSRRSNVSRSDVVLAVTPQILASVGAGDRGRVLPNGCHPERFGPTPDAPTVPLGLSGPVAAVVGQLNERLDLRLLEAVADCGLSLLLVGPRYETTSTFRAALDRLVQRPSVRWVDRVPYDEVPAVLAQVAVGLTPYTASPFNRGSFPLKTLDYLAAGLPVVSTDLPSARSLESPDVALARDPQAFAAAALRAAEAPTDELARRRRRALARTHSWEARAEALLATVDEVRHRCEDRTERNGVDTPSAESPLSGAHAQRPHQETPA